MTRATVPSILTRRGGLALGLSAAALPWLPRPAPAAALTYALAPVEIAPRVWTI